MAAVTKLDQESLERGGNLEGQFEAAVVVKQQMNRAKLEFIHSIYLLITTCLETGTDPVISAGDSAVRRSWMIKGRKAFQPQRTECGGPLRWERFGFFSGREARTVWLEPQNWEAGRA